MKNRVCKKTSNVVQKEALHLHPSLHLPSLSPAEGVDLPPTRTRLLGLARAEGTLLLHPLLLHLMRKAEKIDRLPESVGGLPAQGAPPQLSGRPRPPRSPHRRPSPGSTRGSSRRPSQSHRHQCRTERHPAGPAWGSGARPHLSSVGLDKTPTAKRPTATQS